MPETTELTIREKLAELVGVDPAKADNDEFLVGALTEFSNDYEKAVERRAGELSADAEQKAQLEIAAAKAIDYDKAADEVRERAEELREVRRESAAQDISRKGTENVAEAARASEDIISQAKAAQANRTISGITALALDRPNGTMADLMRRPVTADSPIKFLQRANDDILLAAHTLGMTGKEGANVETVRQLNLYEQASPLFAQCAKAFDTGDAAAWVPTFYSTDLIENIYQTTDVAQLFPRFPWPGPGGTATVPVEGTDTDKLFAAGEATTDDDDPKFQASDVAIGTSIVITAQAMAARTVWSFELQEDSIVPILEHVRLKFTRAFAREFDRALLDGDADGTHQDTGLSAAANDARRLFDGLRKKALADSPLSAATYQNAETFATPLLNMGAYAQAGTSNETTAPNGCVAICDHGTRLLLGFLRDTQSQRVGGANEAISGQRTSFLGYPLIPSAMVRNDLTSAGIYDASSTSYTYLLWVYTPAWHIYDKANLTMQVIDRPELAQRVMVARQRLAFQHMYPSAATTTRMVYYFANTAFP